MWPSAFSTCVRACGDTVTNEESLTSLNARTVGSAVVATDGSVPVADQSAKLWPNPMMALFVKWPSTTREGPNEANGR